LGANEPDEDEICDDNVHFDEEPAKSDAVKKRFDSRGIVRGIVEANNNSESGKTKNTETMTSHEIILENESDVTGDNLNDRPLEKGKEGKGHQCCGFHGFHFIENLVSFKVQPSKKRGVQIAG